MPAPLRHIAQFTPLSPALADELRRRARPHRFGKGELLPAADTVCRRTY